MHEEYPDNISTDGINVAHQTLKSEKHHRSVNFASSSSLLLLLLIRLILPLVFDFGGQEVFYPTHQFFLTGKCLYVLAFDVTNPRWPRLEYWLRTVKWLGGLAPKVIIVGTHTDMLKSDAVRCSFSNVVLIREELGLIGDGFALVFGLPLRNWTRLRRNCTN